MNTIKRALGAASLTLLILSTLGCGGGGSSERSPYRGSWIPENDGGTLVISTGGSISWTIPDLSGESNITLHMSGSVDKDGYAHGSIQASSGQSLTFSGTVSLNSSSDTLTFDDTLSYQGSTQRVVEDFHRSRAPGVPVGPAKMASKVRELLANPR